MRNLQNHDDWRQRQFHEENAAIPAMEAQLREVRCRIDNIMASIEKGVVTRTTKGDTRLTVILEDGVVTTILYEAIVQ